jgi:hypothetical protein
MEECRLVMLPVSCHLLFQIIWTGVIMVVKRSVKENPVENYLVKCVNDAGGLCLKVTAIGRRGFFDRLVVLPGGKIFFVEVKRPVGGRLAKHQELYIGHFLALKANVAIVRNQADIDALMTSA